MSPPGTALAQLPHNSARVVSGWVPDSYLGLPTIQWACAHAVTPPPPKLLGLFRWAVLHFSPHASGKTPTSYVQYFSLPACCLALPWLFPPPFLPSHPFLTKRLVLSFKPSSRPVFSLTLFFLSSPPPAFLVSFATRRVSTTDPRALLIMLSHVGTAVLKRAIQGSDGSEGPKGPQYDVPAWAWLVFLVNMILFIPMILYVSRTPIRERVELSCISIGSSTKLPPIRILMPCH